MKNWKDKVLGIFAGIGIMSLLMTTNSNPPAIANYEFYDLKDTRGLIFNKVTGEIKYEEIRDDVQNDLLEVHLANWNGLPGRGGGQVDFFRFEQPNTHYVRMSDWNGQSGEESRVTWQNKPKWTDDQE